MSERQTYIVAAKFSVATQDGGTVTFEKGDEVDFDGRTVWYYGEEYAMRKFSAAIRPSVGWAVPAGSNTQHRPQSANIKMRGATPQQDDTVSSGLAQVSEEERPVHSLADRNAFLESTPQERLEQARRPQSVARKEMAILTDSNESSTVVQTGRKLSSAKSGALSVDKVDTRVLNSHEADLSAYDQNVSSSEGITFRNEGVSEAASVGTQRQAGQAISTSAEGQVIGKVTDRKTSPQVSQIQHAVSQEVDVEAEDTLDPKTKEGRYEVAKLLHPELPDWDFEEHWATKMAKLRDHHTEDVIALRAIYACESEALKRRIKEEFDLKY